MRHRNKAILAITIAALALPATPAAAKPSRTAYFKVDIAVVQSLTWTENTEGYTCSGQGKFGEIGKGQSVMRLRTLFGWPMVAKRVSGLREATLRSQNGGGELPVSGTLVRGGVRQQTTIIPAPPGSCQRPLSQAAPDCGTKAYPAGTRLVVGWATPRDWIGMDGPRPRVPSLTLRGPNVPEWRAGAGWVNCPGIGGDELLGAQTYPTPGRDAGSAPLPTATLFGTRKRFTARGHIKRTLDYARVLGPSISGSKPVTTEVTWTATFTRLARRPAPIPVEPAPL
jgi:hypothetical protein